MYDQPFFITQKISNNAFNFEKRHDPKLYVPGLKEGKIEDVKTGDQVVFEDFDDDGKLHTCFGLQNFIKTYFSIDQKAKTIQTFVNANQTESKIPEASKDSFTSQNPQANFGSIPVYIFDNHNHAFAFWCQEKQQGNLQNDALLIHIDQHKDTRIPTSFISKEDAQDLHKVFTYTNTVLNVGNFIPAAQHIGLIKDIIFLDSLYSLEEMSEQLKYRPERGGVPSTNLILDIDLDFFAPDSDYIGNDFKLQIIEKLIPKASVITFATSPYFIEQNRAIEWLYKIAKNF